MINQKFVIFAITILSISIVVFNNLAQLTKELFLPKINVTIWFSFALITFGVITYAVVNKNMLRWMKMSEKSIYNKSFFIGLILAILILSAPFSFKFYLIVTNILTLLFIGVPIVVSGYVFSFAERMIKRNQALAILIYATTVVMLFSFSYVIINGMQTK